MSRYFMFYDLRGFRDAYRGGFDTLEAAWEAADLQDEPPNGWWCLVQLIDGELVKVAVNSSRETEESDTRRVIEYGWLFEKTDTFVVMDSKAKVWKRSDKGEWVDE